MKQFGIKFNKRMYLIMGMVVAFIAVAFSMLQPELTMGGGVITAFGLLIGGVDLGDNATPEQMAKAINQKFADIETANKNGASKDDVNSLLTELKGLQKEMKLITEADYKAQLKELKDIAEKQGLEMQKLTDGKKTKQTIKDIVKTMEADFAKLKNGVVKDLNFTIKANTLRASVTNSTIAADLPGIGQIATKKLTLSTLFKHVTIGADSMGVIKYWDWDEATIARAATMVGEGASFPESTAKWKEYTLSLKKIGDTVPVSEELLQDGSRFAAELRNFLQTNVDLLGETQLYSGDDTGRNLKGIYTYATEYVAVASGMAKPDIIDLLGAIQTNVTSGKDSKFLPDFVMMNPTDFNKYVISAKDTTGQHLFPIAQTGDIAVIAGLLVMKTPTVIANTLLVGDSRFATIYEVEGYNVTTGYSGTDFSEDILRLKAKKRMALLVRAVDVAAFNKETSISAALVTLGS